MQPPDTPALRTRRLLMFPLRVADAREMVGVLADPDLHRYIGGSPPALHDLESKYRVQIGGPSSSSEVWHNWILRLNESGTAIGFVQATVTNDSADVAWLVSTDWQGRGFAKEAAVEMCRWLSDCGVSLLTAHIHPDHVASAHVATAVGLQATDEIDADGEVVWSSPRLKS